jgi:hypothetical protein
MMESSDQELLLAVWKWQAGIRQAMASIDDLALRRNRATLELVSRGYSMRKVAEAAEVSPQALQVGVARMKARTG